MYKVSVNTDLSSSLRYYSVDELRNICENEGSERRWWAVNNVLENKHRIMPIVEFLETLDPTQYATRHETRQIDFYTNERSIYDALSQHFESSIIHRYEPSADADLDRSHVIIVDQLPHKRYQYRVYLQPHKLKGDPEAKQKYLDWIVVQDKILISEAVKRWFLKTDWNWDRRYVLVEDEQTLLMFKLRSNELMGTVYTYVVNDK